MDPNELLRIVDAIHRDKGIDKEIVFEGIEAALVSAAKKHYGEEEEVTFAIDRDNGAIQGSHNGVPMDTAEIAERIGAQTAKQVMIQKIREAERDALYYEYEELKGQLVAGVIQRYEGGAATVTLSNVEAILPKGEQIPGESHHPNERVRATVYEVKRAGSRVKIILSRTKPQLVQRLFEQEIPEIAEGVIEIRAISREPGYRTKVAVSSIDQRVDCVGACVGVRGNRIKNIVDELAGERIDIVRYSDDMQALIPNALQPAEVEEVILCQMLGRAIVLVQEDQLSLAIGRRGQNVRLASKLCIWDIEIMTREELDEQIEQAMLGFSSIDGVESELAERLVGEGFLSYDDLEVIEPDALMEMGGLTAEQVDHIVTQAGAKATEAEKAAVDQRRKQREQERIDKSKASEETEGAEATEDAEAAEEAKDTEATGETKEAETAEETAATGETEEAETAEETAATGETEEAETAEETAATGETEEAETAEETAATGETEGAADQSARHANGEPAETVEPATTEAAGEEVVQTVSEPSRQRHAETSDDAIL